MENPSMNQCYFLESFVYHSRQEFARNTFKYPVLNVYFNVSEMEFLNHYFKKVHFGFFSLNSEQFLNKQDVNLEKSIRDFLNINFAYQPDKIFLQTIPKMFGYVFNPVSFWYCYKDEKLTAVLCEVANTFGEKHYYWLNQNDNDLNNKWLQANKEFHVSPFFEVTGYYKFRFIQDRLKLHVDIKFFNQDHSLKLNTWVSGEIKTLDRLSLFHILLKYGWFTPLVVLKIHYQALKLFFKKVKFFSKPVLPETEITHESTLDS